ncbi:MAG: hypothetical protein AB4352_22045 [Hormoscilla sp.]
MKLTIIGTALLLTIASCPERAIAQFGLDRSDFFERGTEQLEREIERLGTPDREPNLTINEEALPSKWTKFVFSEAGFSIWMPLGKVGQVTESTEVWETEEGNIELQGFVTNLESSGFIVAYSDRRPSVNPETIFEEIRQLTSQNQEFELLSDRPLDNYPGTGREFSWKDSDVTITFRIYLLHQRLYILGAAEPNSEEHHKSFTFFNSFQPTTNN